jgi:hypothetical protein
VLTTTLRIPHYNTQEESKHHILHRTSTSSSSSSSSSSTTTSSTRHQERCVMSFRLFRKRWSNGDKLPQLELDKNKYNKHVLKIEDKQTVTYFLNVVGSPGISSFISFVFRSSFIFFVDYSFFNNVPYSKGKPSCIN